MDMLSFMFLYYDRVCGLPQIGAIAVQPDEMDETGNTVIVGVVLNADIEGQEDILNQTCVNPTRFAFAGGIPQPLLN